MRTGDASGVRFPPPLIYLIGLVVGIMLSHFFPVPMLHEPVRWILGAVLTAVGFAFIVPALAFFRRARTPVNPTRSTTALVTSGPYKVMRNPMYTGLAFVYLGCAAFANSPWALVLVVPVVIVVQQTVIAREEAFLRRRFGDEYAAYCARVRRWL